MTGEGSNTDRGRGGRKERGTWRKVSFVTIKQNDTTGLLITTASCWLSVRRSAVLQHKCCPVCIHRVLLRQWCSFQHNWQCNTSRGSDLNPGSVQLLLGLGRTGTGSRERKAGATMCSHTFFLSFPLMWHSRSLPSKQKALSLPLPSILTTWAYSVHTREGRVNAD